MDLGRLLVYPGFVGIVATSSFRLPSVVASSTVFWANGTTMWQRCKTTMIGSRRSGVRHRPSYYAPGRRAGLDWTGLDWYVKISHETQKKRPAPPIELQQTRHSRRSSSWCCHDEWRELAMYSTLTSDGLLFHSARIEFSMLTMLQSVTSSTMTVFTGLNQRPRSPQRMTTTTPYRRLLPFTFAPIRIAHVENGPLSSWC